MKSWITLGLGGLLLAGTSVASAQWVDGGRDRGGREGVERSEARRATGGERSAPSRDARREPSELPRGLAGVPSHSSQPQQGYSESGRSGSSPGYSGRDGRNGDAQGYRGHDDGWRNEYARDNSRGRDDRGRDDRGRSDYRGDSRGHGGRDDRDHGYRGGYPSNGYHGSDYRSYGHGYRSHNDWRGRNEYHSWSYWRPLWSHGWSGHRYRAPSRYYHPRGYSARAWRVGLSVPLVYLASSYIVDYVYYALATPPYGYDWIRIDRDVLLVDRYSGEVVEVLYGFYY